VVFLGELLCGRFPQALEIVQRQVANASKLGDTGFVGDIRGSMGVVLQLMGQYDLAEAEHRKVIADLEASGWTEPEIETRDALAATLLGLRKYSEARQVLQPNIVALEQSHRVHYLGRTLAAASRAELGLGNIDAAWEHALRAVELLSGRHYFWLLEAMAATAALLAERGDVERAVEIYALVNRHPYVANARWFADVFGQVVEKASANLPPDTVVAAKARGEASDLWQAARELLAEYDARLPQRDFDAEHVSG
jgi:tetratricopeptide (TPR) repeat protein